MEKKLGQTKKGSFKEGVKTGVNILALITRLVGGTLDVEGAVDDAVADALAPSRQGRPRPTAVVDKLGGNGPKNTRRATTLKREQFIEYYKEAIDELANYAKLKREVSVKVILNQAHSAGLHNKNLEYGESKKINALLSNYANITLGLTPMNMEARKPQQARQATV